jgi:hypothetical protein
MKQSLCCLFFECEIHLHVFQESVGINFHELPCFCYGSVLTSLLQLGINKFGYKVVDKLATNLLRTNLLQPCHNKLAASLSTMKAVTSLSQQA